MTMSRSCNLLSFFVLSACAATLPHTLQATIPLTTPERAAYAAKHIGLGPSPEVSGELVSWRCDHPEAQVSIKSYEGFRYLAVEIAGAEPRHVQGLCDIQMERRDFQLLYDVEIVGSTESPMLSPYPSSTRTSPDRPSTVTR